jgi:hypothetical protein
VIKKHRQEKDTHGLIPASVRLLQRRLAEVSALTSRRAYFGQREWRELAELEMRLKERLAPIDPVALDKHAGDVIAKFATGAPITDWVEEAIRCLSCG